MIRINRNIVIAIFTFFVLPLKAQYEGSIDAITSGYGSNGNFAVSSTGIINSHWLTNDIVVFYPTGTTSPIPTIFFSHAFGGNDTSYCHELFKHIVSRGYAVVFVPYKTVGMSIPERYATLYDGFSKAAKTFTTIIDTTRAGFLGHSFGGGATPRLASRFYTEKNWGANGKFIFCSAPWYSFELGSTSLAEFPTDCNMITLLYDNDVTNDHRMGMDIFNHIAIPNSNKDCIIVYSDTISSYLYLADHNLPSQYSPSAKFDALDYYAIFRLLDALADYTFSGNTDAKNIALGNGSAEQINMGGQLSPLFVTDSPYPIYSRSLYEFPCDTVLNERIQFCEETTRITESLEREDSVMFYPNPAEESLFIKTNFKDGYTISVIDGLGKEIYSSQNPHQVDLHFLANGVYMLKVISGNWVVYKRFVKQ